jgi:hypothetical protein
MSEPENFITRWSRRKRKAAPLPRLGEGGGDASSTRLPQKAMPDPQPGEAPMAGGGEQTEVAEKTSLRAQSITDLVPDLTQLPPIESITAETDIRGFLAPGVPPELTRAALRRAWTVDPAIRDFIGLSENSWDFNAPDAIAGFGPLEMTDELRREVARFVGRSIADTADDGSSRETKETPSPIEKSILSDATGCTGAATQDAAKPREPDGPPLKLAEAPQPATERKPAADHVPAETTRRSHGGALPQMRHKTTGST